MPINYAKLWGVMAAVPVIVYVFILCRSAFGLSQEVRNTEEAITGKVSWFKGYPKKNAIDNNMDIHVTESYYVAASWNYRSLARSIGCKRKEVKQELRDNYVVAITNVGSGRSVYALPVDHLPRNRRGRVLDVSKSVMDTLYLETDDTVQFSLQRIGKGMKDKFREQCRRNYKWSGQE